MPAQGRRATTLFEVAVSLLVLAIAVTAALAIFPVGIRAQQQARFQLYAGTMATQMIDAWTQSDHSFWRQQIESERLAQNTFVNAPVDFERMLDHSGMGMLPLPGALARRLDSDGDEIARHLGEGGSLSYPTPLPAEIGMDSGYHNTGVGSVGDVPPETQKLVFAVLGYAQQNALPSHPCLGWPYQDFVPSPPQPWEVASWDLNAWPGATELHAIVDAAPGGVGVSGENLHLLVDGVDPAGDRAVADAYLLAARALAQAVLPGDLSATIDGPIPAMPPPFPSPPWLASDSAVFPPPAKILALSYLANATLLATSARLDPPTGAPLPDAYVRAVVDAALAWSDRYAATDPYDFGAPRPLNRQTCHDFPLLQFDLFPGGRQNPMGMLAAATPPAPVGRFPPLPAPSALIADAPYGDATYGTGDVGWRVIGERQPTSYGRARGEYGWLGSADNRAGTIPDNHAALDASWGVSARFNLCRPFAAAERMRELVCWSVEWRAWEDAETLPPDAPDSTRHFIDSRGAAVSSEYRGLHPEAALFWNEARGARWSEVTDGTPVEWPDYDDVANERRWAYDTPEYRRQWMGWYGVDRDGDGELDRGPLPASARMRATLVSRFVFYDRRVIAGSRN
ncbi:MAG TPA: hypothetical protein VEL07_05495 [Planctomycetota bacterium]|nr:hypothetical protein [Planctomycetota bacterium]